MAEINSSGDLIASLTDAERRLKRVERQLVVPRTDVSVVTTSQTTTSATATALTTADTVTVVASLTCLIHIYFEVTASTTSGTLSIYVRDHDAANGVGVNTLAATSSSATPGGLAPSYNGSGVSVPYGSYMTFTNTPKWNTAIGKHTFSLRYSTTAGTATFSDRKLFAWVQPF